VDVEYIGKYKDERTYTQLLILDEWICWYNSCCQMPRWQNHDIFL
jgi:hypothetical protein